jgi:hypothetical protein
LALVLAVAACNPAPSATPVPLGFRSPPVDLSLAPLSLSTLADDAEAALDLCVRPENRWQIGFAARLPSAHDVGKYMPTGGKEPELQADVPVWLFQLVGRIFTRHGTVVDPVCMVRGDEPILYVPYDERGVPVAFEGMRLPTLSLPAIQR